MNEKTEKEIFESYGIDISNYEYSIFDLEEEFIKFLRKYIFNFKIIGSIIFFAVWISCIYFFIIKIRREND